MTREFWNKEYNDPKHLTMSTDPSSDLLEFVKWTKRNAEWPAFPKHGFVVDIGCGNGRNLVPLCHEFNMNGLGTDISEIALNQARAFAEEAKQGIDFEDEEGMTHKRKFNPGLKIEFKKQGAEDMLELEDQSVDVVLDMMVSHQLLKNDRQKLAEEIARVLKPYGWLFFKTFILEGDLNARRMLDEHKITKDDINRHPEYADERNSYIHPHTKGIEHVYTEDEIIDLFSPFFKIHKMKKSHKHIRDGKAHKRRTISVYLERLRD